MCQDQFTMTFNINVCSQEQSSMKALKQTDKASIINIITEIIEMSMLLLYIQAVLRIHAQGHQCFRPLTFQDVSTHS